MPTNTQGTKARDLGVQAVHYLRKTVAYTDNNVAVDVGIIPAGSTIIKPMSGVAVVTAFNAVTTNTLNVGTSADDNLYGTLLAVGATDFVPLDEAVSYRVEADTTITATVVLTGGSESAGEAEVVICYAVDNDL